MPVILEYLVYINQFSLKITECNFEAFFPWTLKYPTPKSPPRKYNST